MPLLTQSHIPNAIVTCLGSSLPSPLWSSLYHSLYSTRNDFQRIWDQILHSVDFMATKVYIVYYSMYGHVEKLAEAIKKGASCVEGVEAKMWQVAETLPQEVLSKMSAPPKSDVPIISPHQLSEADGFVFGFPTRFGMMAAQFKAFLDATGGQWRTQQLAGKPAGIFYSTGIYHRDLSRQVEKLNDQKNWRKGLRVRCLLRRSPKSVLKSKKSEFDGLLDDDETPPGSSVVSPELSPRPIISDSPPENNGYESSGASKTKAWNKGRGKPRHRLTSSHSGRGLLSLSPQSNNGIFILGEAPLTRQNAKGPKMPDGTRGFTMGRGKPISVSVPIQTCQAVV
ncbi:uncharacterized protein LOC113759046 [Coffea eugenioides]|uniref:uncharacterized protein LOC113759046 n=1 Tax=Coffea eugenioides TaxID=49369 RepID=UPI000F606A26|nr:uncharacterized protein LOC113759046 [Coffea eugenioides]